MRPETTPGEGVISVFCRSNLNETRRDAFPAAVGPGRPSVFQREGKKERRYDGGHHEGRGPSIWNRVSRPDVETGDHPECGRRCRGTQIEVVFPHHLLREMATTPVF